MWAHTRAQNHFLYSLRSSKFCSFASVLASRALLFSRSMSSTSSSQPTNADAKKKAKAKKDVSAPPTTGGKRPAVITPSAAAGKADKKKGSSGGNGAGEKSRARRAGLVFPVGRIHRQLKTGGHAKRVGSAAPIYLAAVLEYLTAEILEVSSNNSRDDSRVRIVPRNIMLAIRSDEELHKLLPDITIADAGVLSSIHPRLLLKSGAAAKKAAANATSTLDGVAPAAAEEEEEEN